MSEKNSRNNKFKDKKNYDLLQNNQIDKYKFANQQIMKVPGDGNCMYVATFSALLTILLTNYPTFLRELKRIFISRNESQIETLYKKILNCKNIAQVDEIKN